jgi:hypothetical protein
LDAAVVAAGCPPKKNEFELDPENVMAAGSVGCVNAVAGFTAILGMNGMGVNISFAYTTIRVGSGLPDGSLNRPAPAKTEFE